MIVNPSHGRRRYKRGRSKVKRYRALESKPSVIRRRRKKVSANPATERGTSMKYRRIKRKNPAAKKKTRKKAAKRAGPVGGERAGLVEKAKSMGLKASGTNTEIKARISAKKRRSKAKKKTTRKKAPARKKATRKKATKKKTTRKKASKKAAPRKKARRKVAKKKVTKRRTTKKKATKRRRRPTNHQWAWRTKSAKRTVKGKRGKKKKVATSGSKVSRTYLAVKRVQSGVQRGTIKGGAAKRAKAMGLMKVNPPASVLKDFTQTAKALALPSLLTVGGMYGAAWAGLKLSSQIAGSQIGAKLPEPIAKNIVPISTAGLSLGGAMVLRRMVKKRLPLIKMDGAQLAPWVAVGGLGATLLMFMATTEMGKKITSKMGLSIGIDTTAMAQASAEGSAAATAGLGSYVTVSQYLGAYGVDIDPMGPSWYGRSDLGAVGDYVDASPQNEFGGYMASDFPVHTPGPGDNDYTMATLGDYGHDMELEQTPGGTMITMGEAGIFGGKGII